LATNPPYGQRVGGERSGGDVRNLFDRFGAVLRERGIGWKVAVLASEDTPVTRLGLSCTSVLHTTNGGISVDVWTADVPA
ncbi:MAG TPA: hypothetical protein DCR14_12390, partial [Acidimicrobiaceae bacterium]|nr:hypothetical protein [Acidimicrobiaceae bacterium]